MTAPAQLPRWHRYAREAGATPGRLTGGRYANNARDIDRAPRLIARAQGRAPKAAAASWPASFAGLSHISQASLPMSVVYRTIAALLIGLAGGFIFLQLHSPLPWTLGSL